MVSKIYKFSEFRIYQRIKSSFYTATNKQQRRQEGDSLNIHPSNEVAVHRFLIDSVHEN